MNTTTKAVPRKHTPVTLLVPNDLYQEWVAAANASGHTVDSYLISTVTIATRLKIIEGTQRLPNKGSAIDPLLAEAIRRNSRGKPWEHKADLLLATPGLAPDRPLPQQPDPATHNPISAHIRIAQQLMARYGLPVRQPTQRVTYAAIGGENLTWNQTALVLAMWDHSGGSWTSRRLTDHASAAGLKHRTVEPSIRELIARGIIERRPNPLFIPTGSNRPARNEHRLAPTIATALGEHAITAA